MEILRNVSERPSAQEVILQGQIPILPIEKEILQRKFENLSNRQSELGRELGEAMGQTSETWHDNAPADAINLEASRNSSAAESVGTAIGRGVVVDYPSSVESATLGNLLRISMQNKPPKYLMMVGSCKEVQELLKPDIGVCTIGSPIGEALLGARVDDVVEYSVGKRALSAVVHSIQLPQEAFLDSGLLLR